MCTEDWSLFRKGLEEIIPYIPGKPIEEIRRQLGFTGRVIKMASNENPLGPPPGAVAKMKEVLTEANLYPDGGCFQLRNALSKKTGLEQDQFIFGNGVDNLIPLAVNTFVNTGDEVVMPKPSFGAYRTSTIVAGGIPVEVPLTEFKLDLGAMREAVTARTKMVFICNPNNPTGTIVSEAELDRFMDSLPPGVVVVIDEAYFEYVEDASYPDSLKYIKEGKNVIIFRTFSKIYGLAGLRLGYGMTKPEFVRNMDKIREPFNVNRVVQAGAVEALADSNWVNKGRNMNSEGKQILYQGFDELGFFYVPSEGNFIFADTGVDMKDLFPELLKRGVIIRPATPWGYPTFARISIGTPEENMIFLQELKNVLSWRYS